MYTPYKVVLAPWTRIEKWVKLFKSVRYDNEIKTENLLPINRENL